MKVAIIRGANLNKWEMQNYEPLAKEFDILGLTTKKHKFDISEIKFPIEKLLCIGEIGASGIQRYVRAFLTRATGDYLHIIGLEKAFRDADIIHSVDTMQTYTFQALKVKKKYPDKKLVLTVWENIPFNFEDIPYRKRIKQQVRGGADMFMAITNRAREALLLEGVPDEKIAVIPMGINIKQFSPKPKNISLMKEINISLEDFVILFVGSLTWKKGVYDLLFAANKIIADPSLSHINFKFLFIGAGVEEGKIKKLASYLGIEGYIRIQSIKQYSLLPEVHNLADIFILPSIPTKSWQEQFGFVLVESMACGKPVISTTCGSIPEVVGDAGILIPANDMISIYRAVKELILKPERREGLGKKARHRAVTYFDKDKVTEKIRNLYKELAR